jgi:hypothetical protein
MNYKQYAKEKNLKNIVVENLVKELFGTIKYDLNPEDIKKIEDSGLLPTVAKPDQKQLPENVQNLDNIQNLDNNPTENNESELTPFEREMLSYMELGALEGQALSDAYHATKEQVIKNNYFSRLNKGKEVRSDKKAFAKGGSKFFLSLNKQQELPEYVDVEEITETEKEPSPLRKLMMKNERRRLNG